MNTHEKRVHLVENYLERVSLRKDLLDYYSGRSILITGGAGAIGSNLIIALSKLVGEKGKVVVLDNLSAIKEKDPWNVTPLPNIMFVLGDVRTEVDLKRVFKEDPLLCFILLHFLQTRIQWIIQKSQQRLTFWVR